MISTNWINTLPPEEYDCLLKTRHGIVQGYFIDDGDHLLVCLDGELELSTTDFLGWQELPESELHL